MNPVGCGIVVGYLVSVIASTAIIVLFGPRALLLAAGAGFLVAGALIWRSSRWWPWH